MNIDRCTPIFELFSAFNFAYAILSKSSSNTISEGKSYVDLVDNKLLTPYSRFFERINNAEQEINVLKTSADSRIELEINKKEKANNEVLEKWKSYSAKLQSPEDLVKTWKDKADKAKSDVKQKIDERFPYYSFLFALFSISVLGVAASEAPYKHFILFLLDILVAVLILVINSKITTIKFSYLSVINWYFYALVGITTLHFVLKIPELAQILPYFNFIDDNPILQSFFVLINICIPFSHFVIYFFIFNRNMKKIINKKEDSLEMIETQVNTLKEEKENLSK